MLEQKTITDGLKEKADNRTKEYIKEIIDIILEAVNKLEKIPLISIARDATREHPMFHYMAKKEDLEEVKGFYFYLGVDEKNHHDVPKALVITPEEVFITHVALYEYKEIPLYKEDEEKYPPNLTRLAQTTIDWIFNTIKKAELGKEIY